MKKKNIISLVIIVPIILLVIIALIINYSIQNQNSSNITSIDEIKNEIIYTNEVKNIVNDETIKVVNIINENNIAESSTDENKKVNNISKQVNSDDKDKQNKTNNANDKNKESLQNNKQTQKNNKSNNSETTNIQANNKHQEQIVENKTTEKTKSETKPTTSQETNVEKTQTPKCTDTQHGVGVGNSNKWFNTKQEADSYYDDLIKKYSDQVHNNKITFEEYNKICPCGFEEWSCPYCGKWTLNYYYRK